MAPGPWRVLLLLLRYERAYGTSESLRVNSSAPKAICDENDTKLKILSVALIGLYQRMLCDGATRSVILAPSYREKDLTRSESFFEKKILAREPRACRYLIDARPAKQACTSSSYLVFIQAAVEMSARSLRFRFAVYTSQF